MRCFEVEPELAAHVARLARSCWELFELAGYARVDFRVDAAGTPWVLEVNVSPGMTDTSLLPMAAQAAGWSLAELCERVLRSATSR